MTGDVVVGAGAYLDLDAAPSAVAVGGSVEIHGDGDLRKVTSVGNSVRLVSANGQVGEHAFPGVSTIPGDLAIENVDLLGTPAAPTRATRLTGKRLMHRVAALACSGA